MKIMMRAALLGNKKRDKGKLRNRGFQTCKILILVISSALMEIEATPYKLYVLCSSLNLSKS